jgi:ketosteroid isomerase-like protein
VAPAMAGTLHTAWTMSENLDLARSICEAWRLGDFSSVEWAHPDIELVSDEPLVPLNARGVGEMAEVWRHWLHAWQGFHAEPDEWREVDDERVLVLLRYGGRDLKCGSEVTPIEAATLLHIRESKVTRLVIYWDRQRALEDLGLA